MKTKYKLFIGICLILILTAVLLDWAHFKAGLFGNPPVIEVQE